MNTRVLAQIIAAVLFVASGPALIGRAGFPHDNEQGQESQRGMTLQPPSRAALTSERTGAYFGLVIGIDNYRHLPTLNTAIKDAEAVATILHNQYGFATTILRDATRDQILRAFNGYRRELGENANLLIYYAGHGIYNADKAYWLPVDAEPGDTTNWIIADDITTDVKAIPARHVLIISDSCYSAGITRDISLAFTPKELDRYLDKMLQSKSRTLMSSGGLEPVSDQGGAGHSVFASALIRGLTETSDDAFSAENLFERFIRVPVAGKSEQTPQYNVIRNSGHDAGDFVFTHSHGAGVTGMVRNPSRTPSAKPSPPDSQPVKVREPAPTRDAVTPAPTPAQEGASVAGCWMWPNNTLVAMHPDGTATTGLLTGRWRLVDSARQIYTVTFPLSIVDTVTLTPDYLHLSGANQFGPLSATRLSNGKTGAAGNVVGNWQWSNGVNVTINPDGTMRAGSIVARWTVADAAGRVYKFAWPDPVDTVTLSPDGLHLAGSNQYGFPAGGTKSPCSPGN